MCVCVQLRVLTVAKKCPILGPAGIHTEFFAGGRGGRGGILWSCKKQFIYI